MGPDFGAQYQDRRETSVRITLYGQGTSIKLCTTDPPNADSMGSVGLGWMMTTAFNS
jgi:hypothetical protein